jgi:endoglucanase
MKGFEINLGNASPTLYIDDLSVTNVRRYAGLGDPLGSDMDHIGASQIGYAPDMEKKFSSPVDFAVFKVKRASDNLTVFTGGPSIDSISSDVIGGRTVYIGDFSLVETPGRYKIVAGNMESYPFDVRPDVYDDAARDILRWFYYQRAFTAIEMPYAEGPWVHPSDQSKAPPGIVKGWHDAGDLAIYMPTMTETIFWLLQTWIDFHPGDDDFNIPESGNGIPDLLDGSTFPHTVGDYRKSVSPTAQNTAKAVAVLAYASVVFRAFDVVFADSCLAAAWAGWNWMQNNPYSTDDGDIGQCAVYAQGSNAEKLRSNKAWAASSMLYATGESQFATEYEDYYDEIYGISSWNLSKGFAARMYLLADAGYPARKAHIRGRVFAMADGIRSDAAQHPFHGKTSYYWGWSGNTFRWSGEFSWAAYLLDTTRVSDLDQAMNNLHYVLGRNFLTFCYISGLEGSTHSRVRGFHHWLKALDTIPYNYPGAVGCGPNERPDGDDGYYWSTATLGAPIEARYADNDSWSTNEVAINWQASAVYNIFAARKIARGGAVNWPDSNENTPATYVLYQNYPNPFNPTTTIRFQTGDFGFVSLKIYDVMGQEVATLVNEQRSPGVYGVEWNAVDMPSGVYLCQLQAGNYSEARKLLLLR